MRNTLYIVLIIGFFGLSSCEEIVTLDSPASNNFLVVEASLTNLPGPQKIMLTRSQAYFDNTDIPKISDATVLVKDNYGNNYTFKESPTEKGSYIWEPVNSKEIFGKVGRTYQLSVKWSNESFLATAPMNRVSTIDSILYQFDEASGRQGGDGKPKNGYEAQFYGRDATGSGDCYRLKAYKNGKLFNNPFNLTIIYDAAAQKGSGADGLMFILPIRRAISPELYSVGDKIKVELYSISEGQFNFYSQARLELNNAGLFSRPAANIPTNFLNTNANSALQGAGWFGVSAVSILETTVDAAKARKNLK